MNALIVLTLTLLIGVFKLLIDLIQVTIQSNLTDFRPVNKLWLYLLIVYIVYVGLWITSIWYVVYSLTKYTEL